VDLDYQRWPGIHWLQYGGNFVIAHIRGGGEFGTGWYHAAKGIQRQKAFDDFIAVAEDLAKRGVAKPANLGIYGASNGGALVTAVMVQRPELFGAVVSRVPLTDMLGFTKLFAGPSWVEEYGDPAKAADRAVLARWSPYQNAKKAGTTIKAYPPTLFIGNRNDDRVHPAHARKMVAQMRSLGHAQTWLYEETSGGHSGRTDPRIFAQREALLYTFLWMQLTRESAS
jgi:prolyl oligopeptidase